MQLKRAGSEPSIKGPEEWFTGTVRIDPLNAPHVSCASVTFEPGARTAWHTHPLGQTLLVTAGCGWTQCEGEPRIEISVDGVAQTHVRVEAVGHDVPNPSLMSN
jgi:quercetin dioxygenase-like cupin family protein